MSKTGKLSRKKLYILSAALLMEAMAATTVASAADSPYIATEQILYENNAFAEINFLRSGQGIGKGPNDNDLIISKAEYNLHTDLIAATVDSICLGLVQKIPLRGKYL